jgi:hypothetical protein
MTGDFQGNVRISRTSSQGARNLVLRDHRIYLLILDVGWIVKSKPSEQSFSISSSMKKELSDVEEKFKLEDVPAVIKKA